METSPEIRRSLGINHLAGNISYKAQISLLPEAIGVLNVLGDIYSIESKPKVQNLLGNHLI